MCQWTICSLPFLKNDSVIKDKTTSSNGSLETEVKALISYLQLIKMLDKYGFPQ